MVVPQYPFKNFQTVHETGKELSCTAVAVEMCNLL